MLRRVIAFWVLLAASAAWAQTSVAPSQPALPHAVIFDPLYGLLHGKPLVQPNQPALLHGKALAQPNQPAPQTPKPVTTPTYYGNGVAVPPQNLPPTVNP